MGLTLGLDIGPNSIGWAVIHPEENNIVSTGVRVFPEGVENYGRGGSQESKNVSRRVARGTRRQHQRFKMRRDNLIFQLSKLGMYSKSNSQAFYHLDPYEIRSRGVSKKLSLIEFGRALYHINERRGFLSNRKAGDSEDSKIYNTKDDRIVITDTEKAIVDSGFSTLGQYLFSLNPHEQRRRSRYTLRKMYINEFELLWSKQAEYYADILTESVKDKISGTIFFQRKLKSQKDKLSKCTFEPKKRVSPKSSPTFQNYRILEQVARLRVTTETRKADFLTQDERTKLIEMLNKKNKMTFKQVAKLLNISGDVSFNLEHEKALRGNNTFYELAKIFRNEKWNKFKQDEKNEIWHTLHFSDDPEWLKQYAINKWLLSTEDAEKLSKITLEKDYCRLSHKAMTKIIPFLEKACTEKGEPMTYDKAVREAGYHHSKINQHEGKMIKLPATPDFRNPIVQQAMNEIRKLVNTIVDEYGNPETIKVELVRELKLPRVRREKIFNENQTRRKEHNQIREILTTDVGIKFPSRDDIIKYKLWEESDRTCLYTGNKIHSVSQLFNGEYEIEHILPYSKSLDDSYMNKTLCHRDKNLEKGNQTPEEAWGGTPEYDKIIERVYRLVKEKKFPYPKYKRFLQKDIKLEEFIHRNLIDTAYIATEVQKYLKYICTDVQSVPGTATARLRQFWGLNTVLSGDLDIKNREDHRHHAVDALVVATTERKYIQHFSTFHHYKREPKREHFPIPWERFREDAETSINQILVSHKIKNAVKGRLHKESMYGIIHDKNGEPKLDNKGQILYGIRKSALRLKSSEIKKIADPMVKQAVMGWYGFDKDKRPKYPLLPSGVPIKRVRVHDPHSNVIELRPGVFVEPGSNHHIVIFEHIETGKRVGKVVTLFEAVRRKKHKLPIVDKTPEDGYRFIMFLSINDIVLMDDYLEIQDISKPLNPVKIWNKLYRVQKMDANNNIILRKIEIAVLKDDYGNEPGILRKSASTLKGLKVRINYLNKCYPHFD